MYIDPLKNVKPIIDKNTSNLKGAALRVTKLSEESRQVINKDMLKYSQIYKKALLNLGHVNVSNLKPSDLIRIKVPNINVANNFKNNLFSENTLDIFKANSQFSPKEISRVNDALRYSFINTVKFPTVSNSFDSSYPIHEIREDEPENKVNNMSLQKFVPPSKTLINATSILFFPNTAWKLFSNFVYNEQINIPISTFVLFISLVFFFLTFNYNSHDE
ncbi:hypothetical protein [Staphylococcus hominis]|uniref:hypothetical protein n=1 Tax=Staphylococcus hominis TaxID=1290 RepID=UPI000DFE47CD|nr:hypothetical protein [Staphylococcus hominis]SUM72791.1 hypothetical phage-related protein [Staphylococcus hominis]